MSKIAQFKVTNSLKAYLIANKKCWLAASRNESVTHLINTVEMWAGYAIASGQIVGYHVHDVSPKYEHIFQVELAGLRKPGESYLEKDAYVGIIIGAEHDTERNVTNARVLTTKDDNPNTFVVNVDLQAFTPMDYVNVTIEV